MKYLHTMVRVTDLDASLKFYCDALGLREVNRKEVPQGRFTLVFLAAPGDEARRSSSPTTGIPRRTTAVATSVIWPMQSMTSTPPASG